MDAYPPQSPTGISTAPKRAPRSIGEMIRELPAQYRNILTHPSAATFAEEMSKATWASVWLQLLGWGVISGILAAVARLIYPLPVMTPANTGNLSPETLQTITNVASFSGISIGTLIGIPLSFFISMGILYLIAKVFSGQGTFLTQSYTSVLFQAPLGILSSILNLIPYVGFISFAVFVYGIVLQVFAIMATHRLSGGKATLVVLLPALVVTILLFVLVLTFVSVALILIGVNR